MVESGIEPCAKQHGQDVDRVFTKEADACVDEKRSHGESREGELQPVDQENAKAQHKPSVEKGGAEACQLEIIRDKSVPGEYDGHHAAKKLFRRGQKQSGGEKEQGRGDAECKHFPAFQHLADVFSHTKLLP